MAQGLDQGLEALEPGLEPRALNVLVVDDDDIDRETVCRLLEGVYLCLEAATLEDTLKLLETSSPDCVLLDYHLPDGDALTLLPDLQRADIPVVVLTGEENPEFIVKALQGGAQDYLLKGSFSKVSLQKAITGAVEKVALRREVQEKQLQLVVQAEALETKNAQLRKLASALTLAEQNERHRVAHVIHDEVQQALFGVQLGVRGLQREVKSKVGLVSRLDEVYRHVGQVVTTLRQLTVDLSPPVLQGEGLVEALRWLASQMETRYDLRVVLQQRGELPQLSETMRILLFQLVHELLSNTVQHAQTNLARVVVERRGTEVVILVEDTGRGFAADDLAALSAANSFGLYAVREKLELFGGSFSITSAPDAGTQATLKLPVKTL